MSKKPPEEKLFYKLKNEKSTPLKMSTGEIWSYGLCDFGKSGSQTLLTTYFEVFLLTILGISADAMAIIVTVQTIIGYVQGPIISLLEDSTKSKWGRFRPYFIVTAPLTALLGVVWFLNPFTGESALPFVYIVYILYNISCGFCTTAWGGLTKCITQNDGERQKAFSISKALSTISTTLPSALPVLIEYAPTYFEQWFGMDTNTTLKLVFAVMSSILGILGFVACLTARNLQERVMISRAETPWKNIGMVFKNKNMLIKWLDKPRSLISNVVSKMGPFLFMYCFQNYGLQTLSWGVAGVCAWIPLLLSNKVFKKISTKKMIYLFNIFFIIANIALLIIGYGPSLGFIAGLFITRAFAAIFEYTNTVATTTFDTDIWDHFEWKYGIRNESTTDLVSSWVNIPFSLANPFILAAVLKFIGFQEGTGGSSIEQSQTTQDWIFYLFTIGGAVDAFLTMVPYFFIKLDKKTMDIVHKELEERRMAREGLTPAMELAVEGGGTLTGEIIPKEEEVVSTEEDKEE